MTPTLVPALYRCAGPCGRALPAACFHRRRPSFGARGNRPVVPQCKTCRREAYLLARYGTRCQTCSAPARVDANGSCATCNAAVGLRGCRRCRRLLPLFLSFFPGRQPCKGCLKNRRNRVPKPAE